MADRFVTAISCLIVRHLQFSEMASSISSDWHDTFNEIKTSHDTAYRKINEAMELEGE